MGLPLGLPLGLGEPFFHFRRYIKNVLILYVLLVSIPLFLEKTPNPPGFTFRVYLWVYLSIRVHLAHMPRASSAGSSVSAVFGRRGRAGFER